MRRANAVVTQSLVRVVGTMHRANAVMTQSLVRVVGTMHRANAVMTQSLVRVVGTMRRANAVVTQFSHVVVVVQFIAPYSRWVACETVPVLNYTMKTYWGVDVQIGIFSTSTLVLPGEWSAVHPVAETLV
jgi:hypothetical protein